MLLDEIRILKNQLEASNVERSSLSAEVEQARTTIVMN